MSWASIALIVLLGAARQNASELRIESLPKDTRELEQRFTSAQIDLLEKLNRRDREHLPRVEPRVPGLVVPVTWPDNELQLSPFPPDYVWAQILPKLIVVDQRIQAFGAYEFGRLVRWGPVSTGRSETPTPVGLFHLTWKAKQRRSTDNEQWLLRWYFNFVNARGVSFHQFELPGYPASHACARMLERDAEWLYSWGEQWRLHEDQRQVARTGTTVLIVRKFAGVGAWTSPERLGSAIVELPPIPIWIFAPMNVRP